MSGRGTPGALLATLLAASAGAGCFSVGPDYEPPAIDTPEAYDGRDATSLSLEEIALWWESLGDEQLDGLVREVLAANLDLATAVERVEAARASRGIVAADRYPALDATGSYARSRPLGGTTDDRWTVGGGVAWEVDLFGRVRRSVEAAVADLEAEIEDLRGVRVALAAETVATYLQALSLHERLELAARNVSGQEQSLAIAEERFGAGMAAALDPAQARVNLHATQASVPALELELSRVLHRLGVLSGQAPGALASTLARDRALPEIPARLLVGVPADLLRNRPDLRSLERQLAAQTARVGVATAALYPGIELSGSWDWLAISPDDLFEKASGTGSFGPQVRLPLFQGGRLRSRVRAEEAGVRQVDLQLHQRVLVAQEEVENALVAIVRNRRQVELLAQAVEAADRSVELSRQLYTSGQSDFQNVLDAQRSLFALEDDLAQVRLGALLALVDLYRALGGGWGEAGDPVVPGP